MKNVLIIILLFVSGGCIDEYQIDLPSEAPRIVLDALISNRIGESYVNIGWSTAIDFSCTNRFGDPGQCEPRTFNGPYRVNGLVRIVENNGTRTIELPFQMDDKEGMIVVKPDI